MLESTTNSIQSLTIAPINVTEKRTLSHRIGGSRKR